MGGKPGEDFNFSVSMLGSVFLVRFQFLQIRPVICFRPLGLAPLVPDSVSNMPVAHVCGRTVQLRKLDMGNDIKYMSVD